MPKLAEIGRKSEKIISIVYIDFWDTLDTQMI